VFKCIEVVWFCEEKYTFVFFFDLGQLGAFVGCMNPPAFPETLFFERIE